MERFQCNESNGGMKSWMNLLVRMSGGCRVNHLRGFILRLEQRAQTMLLKALPESMRSEAISSWSGYPVSDIEEIPASRFGRAHACPEAAGGGENAGIGW